MGDAVAKRPGGAGTVALGADLGRYSALPCHSERTEERAEYP
jgi:hypothetical protein